MNLQISRVQHTGIPVTDIERSISFYQKLGFENIMASSFIHEGKDGRVAMMKTGSIVIELYQLPQPSLDEIRKRSNGHIDHIAFDVDDIDIAFEELQKEHFEILEPGPVFLPFWSNGCRYFNIKGPDGERLEFNQVL